LDFCKFVRWAGGIGEGVSDFEEVSTINGSTGAFLGSSQNSGIKFGGGIAHGGRVGKMGRR